jgi:alkylation response protein AidB-like acyl-CoA dehydrogenase
MTEEELRGRVRALVAKVGHDQVDMHTFRGAQSDHGLADELQQSCKTTYDDLVVNPIGIGMGMPTLLTHGSDEMKSPGVEVRPLYQITGEAESNEVFFNDVRIPHANVLGKVGQGWHVVGAAGDRTIKHRCADMLVATEFAKSAAYGAAAALGEDDGVDEATAIAQSYCSEAFFPAAGDSIQIHGGMGFTWEADAHLYFKRAKSSSLLFGDPVEHREKLAARIGL